MNRFEKRLEFLNSENRLRHIPEETSSLLDLVSNDYLGLAGKEKEMQEEFFDLYPDLSFTSSASRLLSRRQKYHFLLEVELSSLYGKEILLFNSGYHANVGTISALASPDTLFVVDSLMHASGHDGLNMARMHRKADVIFFPHNNVQELELIIRQQRDKSPGKEIFIITESIFSMDGDLGPLKELVELKKNLGENVYLYVDEAHGFGVRGRRGLGLSEELNLIPEIDILVGTFGKAAASTGAFVATSATFKNFLLNHARSFIFSTALPPLNMAWTHFMVSKIVGMTVERDYLKQLSRHFGKLLSEVSGQKIPGESQIIPLLCGSALNAVNLSSQLREIGFDVLPIRRPTVPPGGERIRFSLNSSITLSALNPIINLIKSQPPLL